MPAASDSAAAAVTAAAARQRAEVRKRWPPPADGPAVRAWPAPWLRPRAVVPASQPAEMVPAGQGHAISLKVA